MNILIVYCHPSRDSYTAQILEHLNIVLKKQNWNVVISDLYAMNFKGDMTTREYEREALGNLDISISDDVLKEHEKIEQADCIIFLYPVWWSDCPAILKGWFDRVYSVGYAYGSRENVKKMQPIKLGLVICTAGYTNEALVEMGIAQSMQTVMLDDRLGKRFEHKEMVVLGGTLETSNVREKHKSQLEGLITKIDTCCTRN